MAQMPASVVIRPESDGDHDDIGRVVAAAFGSEVEARLVDRIRASPEYLAGMALVALVGDDVVGHVMVSQAVISSDDGDRRISMLSPLAVLPGSQRRGIGGALVRAAIAAADARGEAMVVLEGSPHYYRRFGFEPADRYGITIHLPEWAPPEGGASRTAHGVRPRRPHAAGDGRLPGGVRRSRIGDAPWLAAIGARSNRGSQ